MEDILVILIGIAAGWIYATSHYLKKVQTGQKFDPIKYVATIIIGAAVGGYAALSGNPVTEEYIGAQLFLYIGIIAIIENLIKTLVREYYNDAKKNTAPIGDTK